VKVVIESYLTEPKLAAALRQLVGDAWAGGQVTGARADGAFRWREAEAALAAAFVAEGLRGVRLSSDGFVEDLFADAAYRGHLAGVLVRRAVALANAPGPGVEVFSHGSPLRRG
jgi:carbon-monoxide dehydrogenase medium subunit